MKFAADITIIIRISNNDENSYREEINSFVEWCTENDLLLNVNKTKGLIVDFRGKEAKTPPLHQRSWGGAGEHF